METPNTLVRYEQNQDTKFYLCRECKTHMALRQEMLHKFEFNNHGLFKNMVNVAAGEIYTIGTNQTVASISCISCKTDIGGKFVTLNFVRSAIKVGRFMIDMSKLLLWNGNQMLYADTDEPVENA